MCDESADLVEESGHSWRVQREAGVMVGGEMRKEGSRPNDEFVMAAAAPSVGRSAAAVDSKQDVYRRSSASADALAVLQTSAGGQYCSSEFSDQVVVIAREAAGADSRRIASSIRHTLKPKDHDPACRS